MQVKSHPVGSSKSYLVESSAKLKDPVATIIYIQKF